MINQKIHQLHWLCLILGFAFTSNSFGQADSLNHDGRTRYFLVHLPTGYSAQNDYSLVIAMHGGLGSGPQLETQSQLSVKADDAKFIVVYPDGVKSPIGIRTWNAGECCGYAADNNIDDVGFIISLVDSLINKYSIDRDRVYATGMSNGGFMSYRLACEKPDVLAAIAPVASSMSANCQPNKWVPTIHFHSYNDNNVPFAGGRGDGLSNHYNPPLDSVMTIWADGSNCLVYSDTIRQSTDYDHFAWNHCDCYAEYELYITHDGGHSWPGGKKTAVGDPTSTAISANELMWTFFQKHPKCEETLGELPMNASPNAFVFPNPTSDKCTIRVDGIPLDISVHDLNGRQMHHLRIKHEQNQIEFDLSEMPSGFYVIRYIENDRVKIVRLYHL